jgi:Transposase, Mutator family
VPKHARSFDEQILALYASGMTTREIQRHLRELYGVDVSGRACQRGDPARSRTTSALAEPADGSAFADGGAEDDQRLGAGHLPAAADLVDYSLEVVEIGDA